MRINLNCPFSEKDEAKAHGARWDAARKVWYIENAEDLTPFMRWIGKPADKQSKHKPRKDYHAPVTTGKLVPLCNCDVPPW